MNNEVIKVLNNIKFLEKYKDISNEYNSDRVGINDRLDYVDGDEVLDILGHLGYEPYFDKKEKFYTITSIAKNNRIYKFNIFLEAGMVDMIWVVKDKNGLILGSPIGTFSKRIEERNQRIKKPVFSSYEDLEKILEKLIKLFEDFVNEYSLM